MTEMNAFLRKINSDIYVQFSAIQKRFEFQAGGQYHIRFHPPMCYIMGMKPLEWYTFRERMAPYPADIKAGFNHLYC